MKYLWLLLLCGCAANGRIIGSPPLEERPANDLLWTSAGAGADALLQIHHVKPVIRVPAILVFGFIVRYTPVAHRPVDSGFDIVVGASLAEIIGLILRGHP